MPEFKVGERVSFNSEAGRVSGKIIKKHTEDVDDKGHTWHCSPEAPQFDSNSGKTDHVAMHKATVLTAID